MEQNRQVFRETIENGLQHHFFEQKGIVQAIAKLEQGIMNGQVNPYQAANDLLERYFRTERP